ncbi:Zinc finger protein [Temnothorax longispinosus]|uniref:Zinc finger protein n=1 Tax=Temnothorax longispinosus TaxID=300112 RepID=A0A4S2JQ04_9HYME|nr:Zinc finger protein [Temnothorax longispinosus]
MDVEEGEAKMCRLCGQYEKICIDVFGEDGVRRYLGTKIHEKINILMGLRFKKRLEDIVMLEIDI